ncbi:MAG: molybdopterin-dependent oxidoreductase [Microbacteriaceae bacterium]|nr:molybdopterin-dependent oxidoreductase [Microbacteriaceae bacterium]
MKFQLNGESVEAHPKPGEVLRTVLRDLHQFDVKMGCDAGDCGACTVLLNGNAVHSCLYPAHRLDGAEVTTVAGLGTAEHPHPVQQSFVDAAGYQCGFCTAGLIVTASTLPESADVDTPRLLKNNLCRCTGYRSIHDAICGVSNTEIAPVGDAAGRSVAAPAGMRIATGQEPYTLDFRTTGLLHLAVLGSPHAHARIRSIDTTAAEAIAGVRAVLTHFDSPATLFSTGRHEDRTDDPDDTLVLDAVLRFRGQRVAAIVADSIAIARRARDAIVVEYELIPAVFDPDAARSPGAPLVHPNKGAESRIAAPERNVLAQLHGEMGDVAAALAVADAVVTGTWQTQRINHAALETHSTRGWLDAAGRLVLRTSSQVPFLVRDELCHIFGLAPETVRVFTARVGGGFGGKQELLTEDLVTLAVLKTGKAVQYEFTREDEFTIAPPRHPMRITVTLGALSDGTLTAMHVDELSDTGAYGNHGIGVMFHSVNESISVYRCANKRVDAEAVYTNNLPSGAFRGYGLGQVIFAIESAMDDLARTLDIDPFELRRKNVIVPGDPMITTDAEETSDLLYGSYGLDQCLDLAQSALARPFSTPVPAEPSWAEGTGMALAMIATLPPRGHFADTTVELLASGDYEISVGTADFGSGSTTVHTQLVATRLNTTVDRIKVRQSDTDVTRYDTGAFGSAGVVVAGKALYAAAGKLAGAMLARAAELTAASLPDESLPDASLADAPPGASLPDALAGTPSAPDFDPASTDAGHLVAHGVRRGTRVTTAAELVASGALIADGSHNGTPRSVAFNVHAFRVAVDRATGEVQILQSIQAADAGTVLNPEQLRGQIEGGTAQAIGTALFEELILDGEGRVTTTTFRNYHVPQMADLPVTEVFFAETHDALGPLGAKSMSEAPYNPVAAALANAIRDAIGVRPFELPMSRDRLWRMLAKGTTDV